MTTSKPFTLLLGMCLAAQPAAAQEHPHKPGGAHGRVRFPITCAPAVQARFEQAVAMLHSFGYEEARRGFLEVGANDPACGMAWWGVAMTQFHQHWDQPTPEELAAGRAAAEQAAQRGAKSERERAYIAAINAFYRDADQLDHRTRALAYKAAMERLASDYREDHEGAIFYALALLTTRRPNDTTFAHQKQAAQILNGLLAEHPEHPGIVHYTIHAFDYPRLAELALPAARVYAKVAPAEPHALHMPSHTFTRLGLWNESIASNLAVSRVAKELMVRTHPGSVAAENLHGNDYLVYAYLQLGEDGKALEVVKEMAAARRFDDPNFAAAYALVAAPARYAVERRDWSAAGALELPEVGLRWENYPYARGDTYYANALGAARLGNVERARTAVAELEKLHASLAAAPPRGSYDWAGRLDAMRLAAAGWLAYAAQRKDEAVRLLIAAAEKEEAVGKHPVTPGPLLPAREMLGDLLLELGRPQEALAAYETALAESPKRFNGLGGAARAAELSGQREKARAYYEGLLAVCRPPACQRPAAQQAAAFLAPR